MKKTLKIIIPIVLAVAIVLCAAWYLFVYDRAFTRDMFLTFARYSEKSGSHSLAAWFYNQAYVQSAESEAVAIELAEQYKAMGNYTKAEYTLSKAIADGGGVDLYIALCKTYVEQDKILDAVNMLDKITNPEIKQQLSALRPSTPTASPEPGYYNQYIYASISGETDQLYVSATSKYPSVKTDKYKEPMQLKDGENTIYAVSIGENGLVSQLGVFGYTIGGVIELIEFSDTAVEAAIREALSVSADKALYTNDLWTIKNFTVPADAESYADLQHMVFLEELSVENGVAGQLSNISPLSNLSKLTIKNIEISHDELSIIGNLPHLQQLTLQGCRLSRISELAPASALTYLDLSGNTIRDISALSGMQQLQELYLQSNAVTDLAPLSGCTALTKLDVSSNALTTLSPISTLTGLTWLNAGTNSISELGQIDRLAALTVLKLGNNKLTATGSLSACAKLTELDLSTNQLTDITDLSALNELMHLDFSYNQVTAIPTFAKDCALVSINGSNNQISTLSPLSGLGKLNTVNMDYNKGITSVEPLTSCRLLIEVNVYETGVKDVTPLTNLSIVVNYKPV